MSVLYERHVLSCIFFFFFQAEDGIRDVAVTGVQTCALPISVVFAKEFARMRGTARACARAPGSGLASDLVVDHVRLELQQERSEERRVGKECRSRWSP